MARRPRSSGIVMVSRACMVDSSMWREGVGIVAQMRHPQLEFRARNHRRCRDDADSISSHRKNHLMIHTLKRMLHVSAMIPVGLTWAPSGARLSGLCPAGKATTQAAVAVPVGICQAR